MRIYPDIASLIDVDRYMEAALVRDQSMLIVWGDSAEACFARAREVQDQMMQPFFDGMNAFLEEQNSAPIKKEPVVGISEVSSETGGEVPSSDCNEEAASEPPRRPVLIQSYLTAATLFLITAALGTGWKNVVVELMVDHSYIRLAFILVVPLQFWLALVSSLLFAYLCGLLTRCPFSTVLHAIRCRLRHADYWPYRPDEVQFEVLFRSTSRDHTQW